MTSDWKTSITAFSRYEKIERLSASIQLGSSKTAAEAQTEAAKLESEAFTSSRSQEEYETACTIEPTVAQESAAQVAVEEVAASPGITVGSYHGCHQIASGLTSTVYRSGSKALKLIHTVAPPHDPRTEVATLRLMNSIRPKVNVIELLDSFREEGYPVLVFPHKPLTLADLLDKGGFLPVHAIRSICRDVLNALAALHSPARLDSGEVDGDDEGRLSSNSMRMLLHRDIKPSAVLLDSPSGPAYLADFGSAYYYPESESRRGGGGERADAKILDVGTGPYRPPEVLFGHASYGPPADMWAFGVLLSECAAAASPSSSSLTTIAAAVRPATVPKPIFESPPTHEDGSQLGLILSIFQTLGTPTAETWPEATRFKTTPFEMWKVFPKRPDEVVFGGVRAEFRDVVRGLLVYETGARMTAAEVLAHEAFKDGV